MDDLTHPGRRTVVAGAAALALATLIPWARVSAAADGSLYVVAELIAAPGKEATLRTALIGAATKAPGEPGCLSYQLLEDQEKPGRFLTYENWTSVAALTAHLSSPSMKAAAPMLAKMLAKPFALTKLRRLV